MVAELVAVGARLAVQWVKAVLRYISACRVTCDTFIIIIIITIIISACQTLTWQT
jgi:hypothetical protein